MCVVEVPHRGIWQIVQPPGHHPYALDFIAVDLKGRPYRPWNLAKHVFSSMDVKDTFAWEQPVLAPIPGEVYFAHDGQHDQMRLNLPLDALRILFFQGRVRTSLFEQYGGNYVIIKGYSGTFALMAHLRCGSVSVRKGMTVNEKDPIGLVGNSGRSIQPHLHFQMMSDPDPFGTDLIPFRFRKFQKFENGEWIVATEELPPAGVPFQAL